MFLNGLQIQYSLLLTYNNFISYPRLLYNESQVTGVNILFRGKKCLCYFYIHSWIKFKSRFHYCLSLGVNLDVGLLTFPVILLKQGKQTRKCCSLVQSRGILYQVKCNIQKGPICYIGSRTFKAGSRKVIQPLLFKFYFQQKYPIQGVKNSFSLFKVRSISFGEPSFFISVDPEGLLQRTGFLRTQSENHLVQFPY